MERKCPRTLDKPILLFGLEVEDIGLLFLITGIGSLLIGPMISGVIGMLGGIVLLRLKRDKPSGYVLHWLYARGFQLPGLIPSPSKIKYYGIYRAGSVPKFTFH